MRFEVDLNIEDIYYIMRDCCNKKWLENNNDCVIIFNKNNHIIIQRGTCQEIFPFISVQNDNDYIDFLDMPEKFLNESNLINGIMIDSKLSINYVIQTGRDKEKGITYFSPI